MRLLLFLFTLLLPARAWAATVNPPMGGGGDLQEYLLRAGPILLDVFLGVLVLVLVLYAGIMIFKSYDESAMNEAKQSYIYAIIGGGVVALSGVIAASVTGDNTTLFRPDALEPSLQNIATYFSAALWAALIANTAIQAFRLLSSMGDQELITRARKRFLMGLAGALIVILANAIVAIGLGPNAAPARDAILKLATFMLAMTGFIVVAAVLLGGFLLVISVDESLKERAKQIIKVSLIGLVIVLLAGAIVQTIISTAA